MTMLELSHLTKRYGSLEALHDLSFTVRRARYSVSSARMAPARPPRCEWCSVSSRPIPGA